MKKRLFIALLGVFSLTWLYAAPVDMGSAKKIAREFCNWQSKAAKGDILTCVYPAKAAKSGDFVPYYIFNVGEGNGFVIVSGDDNTMRNVLAYSEKGAFDMENIPDNVRYWLGFYEEQVRIASQSMKTMPAPKKFESHGTPVVAPLLGDISYNQAAPYNILCPIDRRDEKRSMVGCVATAIVTIAKYYEYPKQGRGTVNYTPQPNNVGKIVEDLSKSTYDWDNILPTYEGDGVSSTPQQDTAIALLMRDAGYGASMGYGSDASGAVIENTLLSIVRYLSYDSLASIRERDRYDEDAEWIAMLKTSLDAGIPLYYTGQSKGGGHAFVCDGYDSMDYFHINWGWGDYGRSKCDGFFLIQILDPGIGGIGAGEGAYDRSQYVIYNMVPNGSDRRLADDYRITLGGKVVAKDLAIGEPVSELEVNFPRVSVYNWTAADFEGDAALALYKDGEFVKIISKNEQYLKLTGILTRGNLSPQDKTLEWKAEAQDLEDGEYEIWIVGRSYRENSQWFKIHGHTPGMTDRSYIAVTVEDGKFILRSEACTVNIKINTTATGTIQYWVYDNRGAELDRGQTIRDMITKEVLMGVDYTFKFFALDYDTATFILNVMQDTNVEVRVKQKMGLPVISTAVVIPGTNDVRFLWKNQGPLQQKVYPIGYILYLDSVFETTAEPYDETKESYGEYTFKNVSAGVHTFSIRSVFLDDTTDMVSRRLEVESVASETLSAADCRIYPNPSATGVFTIEVGQACRMQVSSVTGKILYEDKFDAAGQYTLPLQGYAAGMYIVRLFTDDNQSVLLKAFIR